MINPAELSASAETLAKNCFLKNIIMSLNEKSVELTNRGEEIKKEAKISSGSSSSDSSDSSDKLMKEALIIFNKIGDIEKIKWELSELKGKLNRFLLIPIDFKHKENADLGLAISLENVDKNFKNEEIYLPSEDYISTIHNAISNVHLNLHMYTYIFRKNHNSLSEKITNILEVEELKFQICEENPATLFLKKEYKNRIGVAIAYLDLKSNTIIKIGLECKHNNPKCTDICECCEKCKLGTCEVKLNMD